MVGLPCSCLRRSTSPGGGPSLARGNRGTIGPAGTTMKHSRQLERSWPVLRTDRQPLSGTTSWRTRPEAWRGDADAPAVMEAVGTLLISTSHAPARARDFGAAMTGTFAAATAYAVSS